MRPSAVTLHEGQRERLAPHVLNFLGNLEAALKLTDAVGRQNGVRSSRTSVGMMQSTQDRARDDSPGRLHGHGNWTLQAEAAMRPIAVVVSREFR